MSNAAPAPSSSSSSTTSSAPSLIEAAPWSTQLDDARLRCELTDAVVFQSLFNQAQRTDREAAKENPDAKPTLSEATTRMFAHPLRSACEAARKQDPTAELPAYCATTEAMSAQCAAWFYESHCEGEANRDYMLAHTDLCRMSRARSQISPN